MTETQIFDVPESIVFACIVCVIIYAVGTTWIAKNERELEEKELKSRYELILGVVHVVAFISTKSLLEIK